MGSKKKRSSKKDDKKHKKKSKSSSNMKGKGKQPMKEKKDKHPKKVSGHGPMKAPHKPAQPGDVRTPPMEQKLRTHPARQHMSPPVQPAQQARPGPPQQRQQQRPGQQQMKPHTPLPPGMGRQAVPNPRSSQTLSAEAVPGSGQLPPQQPRPMQQGQPAAPQRLAAPRPMQQQQQQQQRQQQKQPRPSPPAQITPKQPSPDQEKTEKKTDRRSGTTGKKISKLLDIKFSNVVDSHKNNLGKLPASVSRAAFDDNLCLNRFEDVICIDQTRVLFADPQLYLNANWVDISKTRKAIVGQLPLPECNVAFWTMIAENDIKGVLIFCDDNEFMTFDAHKTFPMNKETVHISPRITVTHTHRLSVSQDWTMQVYLLCMGDIRKYLHVHFYSWSGEGLLPLRTLWELDSTFRKYNTTHVYMSSAGVGRAATFAALQMVHCKLHDDTCKTVSQTDCIASLREQRLHSVQSLSQSVTIHAALVQHIIDCKAFEKFESDDRVRNFAEQYRNHMTASKE